MCRSDRALVLVNMKAIATRGRVSESLDIFGYCDHYGGARSLTSGRGIKGRRKSAIYASWALALGRRFRAHVNVNRAKQPWLAGWQKLLANRHASLTWKPNPQPIVYRGSADGKHAENYTRQRPRRQLDGREALEDFWRRCSMRKAVEILNAWASTLTAIEELPDRFLASGIYGYQLANGAEIMRGFGEMEPGRISPLPSDDVDGVLPDES